MLWIENVGNLVCTAGYDLGEQLRLVALSTAEGDDKLIKYPAIFQRSDALIITKVDLLPYLNFNVDKARSDMQRLAPDARVFEVSATTGQGMAELAQWLLERIERG
jgi:hydrogenase nickel incorporation protein HypB